MDNEATLMPTVTTFHPVTPLHVSYGGIQVKDGDELKCEQVQDEPKVSFTPSEGSVYTLAMIDPDVSRKLSRHWLVTNIQGGDVTNGHPTTPYKPSAPPFGGGYHRYYFFLYKQKNGHQEHEVLDNQQGRAFFNLNAWAEKYALELVGYTFFRAQRLESEAPPGKDK